MTSASSRPARPRPTATVRSPRSRNNSHIQEPPPPPSKVNPDLPGELAEVILRCLQKDPARRYEQTHDLLEALTAISSQAEVGAAA